MQKVHYYTGGSITPTLSKFHVLCGRTTNRFDGKTMQDGYLGAQNVTCKPCLKKLATYKPIRA